MLPRLYDAILAAHLGSYRQMLFLSGPRQVGKTTTARAAAAHYLDWDNASHRRVIAAGPDAVAERVGAAQLRDAPVVVALDEIHKYGRWKNWLKGFYDTWGDRCRVVVTGSSRLDVFRRGGDSLMGRYFLYRMHPLTTAELGDPSIPATPIRAPRPIPDVDWRALIEHGGFPEPFTHRTPVFSRRWQAHRRAQLTREDVRDLTNVRELAQIGLLVDILNGRSATALVASNLANDLQVAPDTVKRWVEILTSLHHGFLVRPWSKSVVKSLRKEPRWFLRDWSVVDDPGARAETFVACHLLKAVEGWTDLGLGTFEVYYLRDKQGREVDFLVVRDGEPWFLAEVKSASPRLGPSLGYFQAQTGAPHAFSVVLDLDYVAADCFARHEPTVVPARTFLSQLL